MSSLRLLFTILLLAAFSFAAHTQTGSIVGRVVDQATLEPLPGANVFVLTANQGASTGSDGRFEIPRIEVGTYQLRCSIVGYQTVLLSDVVVSVGKPAEMMFRLTQTVIGVEGVEVTASFFAHTPDAPVSVQKLDYEEIRRFPGGFEDIVRAVSILPGVAQAQPGRNDLVVRGGSPAENLFVVDNIEIPNINHYGTQGASGGPLSYINVDFVRETSFSTGGFGVRYGDKMSSVLSIDLRDGRDDRIGGKATISASLFGLNVEGPIARDAGFILSARRSYLDFIFKAAGFAFVPEYWDFFGRFTWKIDRSNSLTFLGVGAIDDISYFNGTADQRFDNSRILGTAQRQYASGFTWQHLYGNGYSTLTLGRNYVSYNGLQRDSLLNPVFSNLSVETETSLRAESVMRIGGGTELSTGVGLKRVRFTSSLGLPGYVSPYGDTLKASVQGVSDLGMKGSAYVQVSQKVAGVLDLTVGGRMDYYDLMDRKFHFSPRGSIAYQLTPLTTLSVSAGVYYQSPSSIWLIANPSNRGLDAAHANQYILGLEHLLRVDVRARIEVFRKDYGDYPVSLDRPYLILSNTGAGYGGSDDDYSEFGLDRLVNGGKGRAVGVEFLMQKKLSEIPAYGIVSATLEKTTFRALDGVERPGNFDQRVIINLSGGYRFDERWEASAKFRFSSGRPFTPYRADGTRDVAQYNAGTTKSLHSLDVRVDRRWNFPSWTLVAYVDVQNVYNNRSSGAVQWNARLHAVEGDDTAIGILPSIGVSAEL